MATELAKELIESGIHFGHKVGRWNPKMRPYIFGKRNMIHIINVKETLRGLLVAKKFIAKTVSSGKDILFVGTKRQARRAVQENASRVDMHWVIDRWLGGTLTNFRVIRSRVARLDELEGLQDQGLLDQYSKKEGAALRREMRKILRNLGGIRDMKRLPGAVVVIDQKREINAVREANKLGIPVVALLDTDSDPDVVDIPIPGNDDGMRAIELIVRELAEAVEVGKRSRTETKEDKPSGPQFKRRSRRAATARAQDAGGEDSKDASESSEEEAASAPAGETATAEAPASEESQG